MVLLVLSHPHPWELPGVGAPAETVGDSSEGKPGAHNPHCTCGSLLPVGAQTRNPSRKLRDIR